jgi:hypothetical protein
VDGSSQFRLPRCERIRDAGGIVIVAYSLRDVMEGLWKARRRDCAASPSGKRRTGAL